MPLFSFHPGSRAAYALNVAIIGWFNLKTRRRLGVPKGSVCEPGYKEGELMSIEDSDILVGSYELEFLQAVFKPFMHFVGFRLIAQGAIFVRRIVVPAEDGKTHFVSPYGGNRNFLCAAR